LQGAYCRAPRHPSGSACSPRRLFDALGIAIPPTETDLLAHFDALYATFVARDCDNPTIAAASEFCIDLMGNSLIPPEDPISITERSYIVPDTTTGGYVPAMVYPYIIAHAHNFVAVQ
jgi:hypothetical protein